MVVWICVTWSICFSVHPLMAWPDLLSCISIHLLCPETILWECLAIASKRGVTRCRKNATLQGKTEWNWQEWRGAAHALESERHGRQFDERIRKKVRWEMETDSGKDKVKVKRRRGLKWQRRWQVTEMKTEVSFEETLLSSLNLKWNFPKGEEKGRKRK